MSMKRVPVRLSEEQYKMLQRLAAKFGLDVTNTIRHLIARVGDQELRGPKGE